jgi:hypothetical protein
MNKPLAVDIFNSLKHLKSDHHNGFEREGFAELFEEGLQRIAQSLHNHHAFLSLGKVLVDLDRTYLTLRMPRSLALPSASRICKILD